MNELYGDSVETVDRKTAVLCLCLVRQNGKSTATGKAFF